MVRQGEFEMASSIMSEAAEWLAGKGQPLWPLDEVSVQRLRERCKSDEILVGYIGAEPVVAALLQWSDPFFWPGKTDSGFIHKLAIRRAFAGQGHPAALLLWAANACRAASRRFLRLDCVASREKLCAFYEQQGFRRVGLLVREPYFRAALYELELNS